MRRSTAALGALVVAAAVACSSGSTSGPSADASPYVVYVSAPVSTSPWVAQFETNGAELAADRINADGGVKVGSRRHTVSVRVVDNGGSSQQAAAVARAAVAAHAAVLIMDGVGAAAVADVTGPVHLPTFVVF